MRVLVTGADGFIGAHLCDWIRRKTHCRWLIDTDTWYNDVDLILNIASAAEVSESIANPRRHIRNNTDLMLDVLEFARNCKKLRHVIHLSTNEVYGPCAPNESKAEWSSIVTHSPYAASKAAQEAIGMAYWKSYGVPLTIVNTMNVFGERQKSHKFIPYVVKQILGGQEITIHAQDGQTAVRRYIHADCLSDALLHLAIQEYPHQYVTANVCPRFNIAGETEISLDVLVQQIAAILGRTAQMKYVEATLPGHGGRFSLDTRRMNSMGWIPPIPFRETLEMTVKRIAKSITS